MVEVKVSKRTGKCEIVDEAEGTPGSSRQITKFRQYCLPVLENTMTEIYTNKFNEPRMVFERNVSFVKYGFVMIRWNDKDPDFLDLIWDYKDN